MKLLKIMRGIPGSGKSTYAQNLLLKAIEQKLPIPLTFSADQFFMRHGEYKFDPSLLGAAHQGCLRDLLRANEDNVNYVIIDNTNINLEDIAPYVAVGEALGYQVEIVQIDADPEVAAARNVHGVPRSKVLDMHRRLNSFSLPRRWNLTRITP